jgi:alpha-beta hydrolase superfamily lysophospholipase
MKTIESGKRAAILAGLVTALVASAALDASAKRVVEHSVGSEITMDPAEVEGAKAMSATPMAANQEKIPCMVWVDKQEPKAAMLCIHGFGLHKGTYDAFANEMAKMGIATYAIDVRGFGAWVRKGKNRIDFDGTMSDIGLALNEIRRLHPDLKIIVLGESMGGAIAMKAAQMYPDMVYGLISSVPAGDRYDKADSEMGVVKHVFLHGFDAPLDVGPAIVGRATKKDSLKQTWLNDPLTRTEVSANELIAFKNFMNSTFDMAPRIKNTKVLFIQGSNDKLVRPAGTYKLFGNLATPHREIVLSKTAEHLIFEDGQFNNEDLKFVSRWISNNIAPLGLPSAVAKKPAASNATETKTDTKKDEKLAAVATTSTATGTTGTAATQTATTTSVTGTTVPGTTAATTIASKPATNVGLEKNNITKSAPQTALSYWIELKRKGKVYRCNNKTTFKSGDAIRFHVMAEVDGYAYVVLQQGSTGSTAVLFPSKETGEKNFLRGQQDYPLPYDDWLAFDDHPGLEKVRIMFSKNQIAMDKLKPSDATKVAYVSPDLTGAKDLIGTRMQLSWDESNPIIMPDEVASAAASHATSSQVKLVFDNPDGTLAVDVALLHQ